MTDERTGPARQIAKLEAENRELRAKVAAEGQVSIGFFSHAALIRQHDERKRMAAEARATGDEAQSAPG